MPREIPQTTLLRVAAFVLDTLALALVLILPSSLISYATVWLGGSMKIIAMVWYTALSILFAGILLRDGFRGRSFGKRLLGLRLQTHDGKPCSYRRSLLRNFPLLVPIWNIVEVYLVVFGRNSLRTGDRMARTMVTEE